ncbi:MAG: MarR family transcriptional regulator [Pseudomonadota bacterium]
MTKRDFYHDKSTRSAFLGKSALDLCQLSSEQVQEIYDQRGIDIPVLVSSTLLYLHRFGAMTLADIARALMQPHQLIAQRIDKLTRLKLVRRKADPRDGRRFELHLTKKGREQAARLSDCMDDMAIVYGALYREIECDLPQKLNDACDALAEKPLSVRFEEMFGDGKVERIHG